MATTSAITVADSINLITGVANASLGYLTVAVTILALLGTAFYIFNFRPLTKTLERQEERFRTSEKESTEAFLKFKDDQQSLQSWEFQL